MFAKSIVMSKTWTYLLGSFVALSAGSTFVVAHEMNWLGTKTTTSSSGSSITWSSGTDYSNQFDAITNISQMEINDIKDTFSTLSNLTNEKIDMLKNPKNTTILKKIFSDQEKMKIINSYLAESNTDNPNTDKGKLEKLLDPYLLKAISTDPNLKNVDKLKGLIAIAPILKLGHKSLDKVKRWQSWFF